MTTGNSFFNSGGNISADNFNVTAGNVFLNDFATIDVDNFNVTAMTNFINWGGATINVLSMLQQGTFTILLHQKEMEITAYIYSFCRRRF